MLSAMDPVTHLLTGACLARTGFNRKAAYATLAMTVAAEMPDLDIVWGLRGPIAGFEHHRGITHTFVGLPVEAAVIVGAVWAFHRFRSRRSERTEQTPSRGRLGAPVRWGLLYGFSLVALLSHLLLDWTNTYGIRPFFPFQSRWYAGSFVFIIEPLMLLMLLAALLAPPLFGLIAGEVGARRKPFRGRGWAIASLLGIVCLWALRFVEHDVAMQLATNASYGVNGAPPPEVLRVTASPSPINPFFWHAVAETPAFYQFATVDTRRGVLETDAHADTLYKPPTTLSTLLAKRSWLGRVYLDWSSWPVVTEVGPSALPSGTSSGDPSAAETSPATTEVTFRDLRFLRDDARASDGQPKSLLGGEVFLDLTQPETGRIVAMTMNGAPQK
ncbi:MAG: metal-dependent hydrolase [Acidobacteriaceae bacterium]